MHPHLTASANGRFVSVVQFDHFLALTLEAIRHGQIVAAVGLMPIGELTPAFWTFPEWFLVHRGTPLIPPRLNYCAPKLIEGA
jgi:hypothetical protein